MKSPIDYAPYELEAKKLLKEISDLLRKTRHKEAVDMVDEIIVELRMMKAAINSHIKH